MKNTRGHVCQRHMSYHGIHGRAFTSARLKVATTARKFLIPHLYVLVTSSIDKGRHLVSTAFQHTWRNHFPWSIGRSRWPKSSYYRSLKCQEYLGETHHSKVTHYTCRSICSCLLLVCVASINPHYVIKTNLHRRHSEFRLGSTYFEVHIRSSF